MGKHRRDRPLSKTHRAGAIRPPKAAEMEARRQLLRIMELIEDDVVRAAELAMHWDIGPTQVAAALRGVMEKWQDADDIRTVRWSLMREEYRARMSA